MSLNHSPSIVTDGLVLCLDAANQRSYPKSGTTWSDLKGSNNGTLTNMDFANNFNTDNGGNFTFDGADEDIRTQVTQRGQRFSFSLWVKIDYSNSDTYARIIEFGNNNYVVCCINKLSYSNKFTFQKLNVNNAFLVSQTSISGMWQHITCTYDDNVQKLYINAIEEDSSIIGSRSASDFRWYFGGSPDATYSTVSYLAGQISNVSIYSRALTADEIRQNYEATIGRYT